MMDQLLSSGFMTEHITQVLQPAYAEWYRTLFSAIQEHLVPLGVTVALPSTKVVGGYFIWITLPPPLLAGDVVQRSQREQGLRLAPGNLFRVPREAEAASDRFANNIRLCFAWAELRHLEEGVRRLARVLGG